MVLYKEEEVARLEMEPWKKDAVQKFSVKMRDKDKPFPCIPATIAHRMGHIRFSFLPNPEVPDSVALLARALDEYAKNYRKFGNYTSLVLFYKDTNNEPRSVEQYEQLFWAQLNECVRLDATQWPAHIPVDAGNPLWEFCFKGEPLFVYCGTPAHVNRQSRHFPYLMLAITPRSVLVEFNSSKARSAKIKDDIRNRLAAYDQAPIHPDLNTYGHNDNFEWKQYFLRDDGSSLGSCPFHHFLIKGDKAKGEDGE
ncbi:YqcI/YcgG family protein [Bacillus sp. FJAT-27245]|uniref:YqcI/YcgG family protein n=1 Tax=Bacillus sp. FJAT-27245 TaxID=1684144 RepID=UPI0006A75DCB|nr:YqcI/YcgG family protein [Bacillus sp. FJAT-27245]